jgi:hypothetical protein
MRISDQIYCEDHVLKRSEGIAAELKKLLADLPGIEQAEMNEKEIFWELLETQRKAKALSWSPEMLKKIQGDLWSQQQKVTGPRKEFQERVQALQVEQAGLINPIRRDIFSLIEREKMATSHKRAVKVTGTDKRLTNFKQGEVDVSFVSFLSNLKTVDQAMGLLTEFEARIRAANDLSLGGILSRVKEFEKEFNKLDFSKMEKEEMDESTFKELKIEKIL